MRSIIKTILNKTTCNRMSMDWDYYRKIYLSKEITFNEYQHILNAWYHALHNQEFHNTDKINECFKKLNGPLYILELGCYRGALATTILKEHESKINTWHGYDICSESLKNASCKNPKFYPTVMDTWFYNIKNLPKFNVFVSTHTLEHMSNNEAIRTLDWVRENLFCNHIIIEMPIPENGKIWKGGRSAHVLSLGRKHFRSYFQKNNWEIIVEFSNRANWGAMFKK